VEDSKKDKVKHSKITNRDRLIKIETIQESIARDLTDIRSRVFYIGERVSKHGDRLKGLEVRLDAHIKSHEAWRKTILIIIALMTLAVNIILFILRNGGE